MNFETNTVKLPKIGEIKAVFHRKFEGELKTATVSRTCKGHYYISILVEDGKELPEKQKFSESTTIGIDVGIKDFAVLSTGEKIENPEYLKTTESGGRAWGLALNRGRNEPRSHSVFI
ncbi:Mobile element protein [Methanosarcina siciliae C2J]|uniref:Mobile element protein n=1 Tax=Methanosarcina siciliae C2J TaxID=1434118 RepID=A0A0E3LCU8_9EURY|nr:Mobile element protein [Methanosarcina siciliae C2J]